MVSTFHEYTETGSVNSGDFRTQHIQGGGGGVICSSVYRFYLRNHSTLLELGLDTLNTTLLEVVSFHSSVDPWFMSSSVATLIIKPTRCTNFSNLFLE